MAKSDWAKIKKLVADCKKSGGRKLSLVYVTDDALFLDEIFHWIAKQLPDLESLSLTAYEATIVEVLIKHVEHLPKLQALDHLVVYGDTALQVLAEQAENLPPILYFDLVEISDAGLIALSNQAEKFGELQGIAFDACSFGDQGLRSLAAQAKHFAKLDALGDYGSEQLRVSENSAMVLKNFTGLTMLALEVWPIGDAWLMKFACHAKPFSNLEILDLGYTDVGDGGVAALIKYADKFPNLQYLRLPYTEITDDGLKALAVAWEDGSFQNLETLSLCETKVRCVSPEVCETEDARQIFEAVLDGLEMPVAKVVVLGEPAVGKTSLCSRLFLHRIANPTHRRETHDFELITPLWRPHVRDLDVQLRVWDFGGQHVLHGTHEMFLTSKSVCLIVLDATQVEDRDPEESDEERDGNRLPYWLNMIRHFVGEGAHVIVVVTKCDKTDECLGKLDFEKLQIEHRFTTRIQVVDGFSATDKSKKGVVKELKKAIVDALEQMEDLHNRVPREFVGLKECVEHEVTNRALFSLEEYRTWCRKAGIRKNRDQDAYLRTLHHFGSVFYFGVLDFEKKRLDESKRRARSRSADDLPPGQIRLLKADRDPTLQRWLINPHWLKRPVYELIRESERRPWLTEENLREAVNQSAGEFDLGDSTATEDVLRSVLKLTELCFYDESRGKYFFPRGLPDDSSSYLTGWDARHEVAWHWDFFPEAVIHRFIVQAHQHDEVYQNAQWRTGAVLKSGEAKVAIQSHPERGEVTVWLLKRPDNETGPSREDQRFLERLRHRLCDLIGRDPNSTEPCSQNEHAASASPTSNTPTSKLPRYAEKAYLSYQDAAEKMEGEPTDREAYDWLNEHGTTDYDLPDFDTWLRYVREGRKHYGTSKNSPRAGRSGRSIVPQDEL